MFFLGSILRKVELFSENVGRFVNYVFSCLNPNNKDYYLYINILEIAFFVSSHLHSKHKGKNIFSGKRQVRGSTIFY